MPGRSLLEDTDAVVTAFIKALVAGGCLINKDSLERSRHPSPAFALRFPNLCILRVFSATSWQRQQSWDVMLILAEVFEGSGFLSQFLDNSVQVRGAGVPLGLINCLCQAQSSPGPGMLSCPTGEQLC